MKKILIFIMSIILLFNMTGCNKKESMMNDEELYETAVNYLKENNNDSNKKEKDYQLFISYEGLGVSEDDTYKYVYMWILDESYYIVNNKLFSSSGSSMAYKFTFKDNKVIKYEIPEDGTYYKSSINKIFPSNLQEKILNYDATLLIEENKKKVESHYSYLDSLEIH